MGSSPVPSIILKPAKINALRASLSINKGVAGEVLGRYADIKRTEKGQFRLEKSS